MDDYRPGPDGGSVADFCQDQRSSADPTVRTDGNSLENTVVATLNPAFQVAGMLLSAAENLDTGSDLRSFSDRSSPQDTVRAHVNTAGHAGLGMSEKRTEFDTAFRRTRLQSKPVICSP
jgi:hypothetical protein